MCIILHRSGLVCVCLCDCVHLCSCVLCASLLPTVLQSAYHLAKPEILSEQLQTLGLQQDKVRCAYVYWEDGRGRQERDSSELYPTLQCHSFVPSPQPLYCGGLSWEGKGLWGWHDVSLHPPCPSLPPSPPLFLPISSLLSLPYRQPSSRSPGLVRAVWWWRG